MHFANGMSYDLYLYYFPGPGFDPRGSKSKVVYVLDGGPSSAVRSVM